jgi:hypothetical protein
MVVPEFDIHQQLIVVALILNEAGVHDYFSNLLKPQDFGVLPWEFLARSWSPDLSQNSFGTHRRFEVKDRGLVVDVDVVGGKASVNSYSKPPPAHRNIYKIDSIEMSIKVGNFQD